MSNSETVDTQAILGLDQAKAAWARTLGERSEEEKDRLALATAAIVRGIALHGSISPETLGAQLGLEPARARELLPGLANLGMEIDGDGNIIGAALTKEYGNI